MNRVFKELGLKKEEEIELQYHFEAIVLNLKKQGFKVRRINMEMLKDEDLPKM